MTAPLKPVYARKLFGKLEREKKTADQALAIVLGPRPARPAWHAGSMARVIRKGTRPSKN